MKNTVHISNIQNIHNFFIYIWSHTDIEHVFIKIANYTTYITVPPYAGYDKRWILFYNAFP